MLQGNLGAVPPEELIPVRDLVAEKVGIYFEEKRFYFLEKRVLKRMKETNCSTVKDYYRYLKLGSSEELKELVVILTTNETYFYRNLKQLESFIEEALPLVLEEKKSRGDKNLNIWCAACSSGEEPYSISILLKEFLPDYKNWKIKILATDIDHVILEKAKAGLYEKRAVKDIPPTILKKYFTPAEGNRYQLSSEVMRDVRFELVNLVDRREMRKKVGQDFVFCRNVLIYFDMEGKRQVTNSIYDCLNKGGFIFLGHSESVGKISAVFKLVKLEKSVSYRK